MPTLLFSFFARVPELSEATSRDAATGGSERPSHFRGALHYDSHLRSGLRRQPTEIASPPIGRLAKTSSAVLLLVKAEVLVNAEAPLFVFARCVSAVRTDVEGCGGEGERPSHFRGTLHYD